MATDFPCQQLGVRSNKAWATAAFLSALLAIQVLGGTAMAEESTYKGLNQPSQAPTLKKKALKRIPTRPKLAPLINAELPSKIPGEYIIVFKPGTPRDVVLAAQNRAKRLGGTIKHIYQSALIGFSVNLPDNALQVLRANPNIAFVENDQDGSPNITQPPDPPFSPPTGLDRTSERGISTKIDGKYTYSESGSGKHVYVIDSGIDDNHSEFKDSIGNKRVVGGRNVVSNSADTSDCSGHGTAIAGTIGGKTLGIAKEVTLHPVRATNCSGADPYAISNFVAAVDWVKINKIDPAVVNLSYGWVSDPNNSLAIAVTNSIASGVTYVIAAVNGNGADACGWSPGKVSTAITVGAVNPATDTRWPGSNIGQCLDLFAPGHEILSAKPDNVLYSGCTQISSTSGSMTQKCSGTSIAAAHVTGVAARILSRQLPNTSVSPPYPQAVWNALHHSNNVKDDPITGTTKVNGVEWQGILPDPGTGSPNEMLHYGSLNDGYNDGDPHIMTVNGIHYDFQPGGEFVALRDANGMEIQTRQSPVSGAEHVSINTAIAARVGKYRVTWQPGPNGPELRVAGVLTPIGTDGLDLGGIGRIVKSAAADGLEIHFPDGTLLIVTSHWWDSQKQWYLNVRVFHTSATEGIMGAIEPDSWLRPEFAETWRVNDETSLFDYATGQSTKTFTFSNFPMENIPPVKPENEALAKRACDGITDKNMLEDCLFDVAVTGDPIFGKSARIQQQIQRGATSITVTDDKDPTRIGEQVTYMATVARLERGDMIPTGSVLFLFGGKPVGKPARLDSNGQARWKTRHMMVGNHRITARYVPDRDSVFLPSRSFDEIHTVEKRGIPYGDAAPKKHDGK
jgi:subtilisin family serine protease